MSVLVPNLANKGFVRETIIFKTWNVSELIIYKYAPPQGELSNILIFLKQWREAPETGSPSFPISSTEIHDIVSMVYTKVLLLFI